MSYGLLMQFVRQRFDPTMVARNGSMLRHLYKRFPESEVEAMVRGAHLLGWTDLRAVYAEGGDGRRQAMTRYWDSLKRQPISHMPVRLKQLLWDALGGTP